MLSHCCPSATSLKMHRYLIYLQQVLRPIASISDHVWIGYKFSLATISIEAESASQPGSLRYIGGMGMHLLLPNNAPRIFSKYR